MVPSSELLALMRRVVVRWGALLRRPWRMVNKSRMLRISHLPWVFLWANLPILEPSLFSSSIQRCKACRLTGRILSLLSEAGEECPNNSIHQNCPHNKSLTQYHRTNSFLFYLDENFD